MRTIRLPLLIALSVLSIGACRAASRIDETRPPDLGKRAVGRHGAVSSAHPLASEAGLAMLKAGGNATDAAVAAAFAIGVVEPEMSGVGGGGGLLRWDQRAGHADFVDFYPSQPVARWRGVTADSTVPLRVAAIPGNVAGLLAAHARFGRLTRAQVMAPAIALAERGFPLYPVLADFITRDTMRLARDSIARRIYWRDGRLLQLGDTLRNPALGEVLRRIADQGRDGFYTGVAARALVNRLNAGGNPATLEDVAAYPPQWKRPLCTVYRGRVVLSAPPPMGGVQFLSTLEMLETHDVAAMGLPTRAAASFDLLASAMRVGILNARSNDDPRWTKIPARGYLSPSFAEQWKDVVGEGHAADSLVARDATKYDNDLPAACARYSPFPDAAPSTTDGGSADRSGAKGSSMNGGSATGSDVLARRTKGESLGARALRAAGVKGGRGDLAGPPRGLGAPEEVPSSAPPHRTAPSLENVASVGEQEQTPKYDFTEYDPHTGSETTHISVVDDDGNAVSVTVTNSSAFGAKVMAAGFWINDSGWWPRTASAIPATLPAAWRTRNTTIAPSIFLLDGKVDLVIGSPGGGRIPFALTQAAMYAVDFRMDPLEALRMPRIYPTIGRRVEVEGGFEGEVLSRARAMGYLPESPDFGYARVYMIGRRSGEWVAAADPRHDGQARAY